MIGELESKGLPTQERDNGVYKCSQRKCIRQQKTPKKREKKKTKKKGKKWKAKRTKVHIRDHEKEIGWSEKRGIEEKKIDGQDSRKGGGKRGSRIVRIGKQKTVKKQGQHL